MPDRDVTVSDEIQPPQDEWTSTYEQARVALNTPTGTAHLPATTVMRLVTEVRRLRADSGSIATQAQGDDGSPT